LQIERSKIEEENEGEKENTDNKKPNIAVARVEQERAADKCISKMYIEAKQDF
jgi:hypothetical protein